MNKSGNLIHNIRKTQSEILTETLSIIGVLFQGNGAYDSTQFTGGGHGNMLYSASLQSPDSITGYSLNSQTIDIPAPMKPASDK